MRNRVLGTNILATVATVLLIVGTAIGRQVPNADSTNPAKRFRWPNGRRAAVSLSFDDARVSQIDTGLALRVPHKFLDSNRVDAALREQCRSQSNVLESPEPAEQRLWSGRFFRASIQSSSETANNDNRESDPQFFINLIF